MITYDDLYFHVVKFLSRPDILKALDNFDFKFIYKEAQSLPLVDSVSEITKVFTEILNLNPLQYLDKVPKNYYREDTDLTSLVLPDNITDINNFAFKDCKALTNITFSSNLQHIGVEAFANIGITSLTIPNTIKTIWMGAFQDCYELAEVKFEPNAQINMITENCFCACSNLKRIELPESIDIIYEKAFRHCVNLNYIKLPKNLVEIDRYAFDYIYPGAIFEVYKDSYAHRWAVNHEYQVKLI